MHRVRGGRRRALVVLARYVGVEGCEQTVRIIPIEPYVPIIVRFEHMRLVQVRRRVVGHRIVGDAMECRPAYVSGLVPGTHERKILDRDELEGPVRLRLVDENAREERRPGDRHNPRRRDGSHGQPNKGGTYSSSGPNRWGRACHGALRTFDLLLDPTAHPTTR